MTAMPDLETDRLRIRPFVIDDLQAVHAMVNAGFGEIPLEARRNWLTWQVMNYGALAGLMQPPYGDRAVVLKAEDKLIGQVGLVQSYGPFGKLPYFRARSTEPASDLCTPEMGLFWLIDPAYHRKGYATEAAGAIIRYMFRQVGLKRIVATTEYDNQASIGVMQRLGMTIEHNPDSTPEWFQVVGILENPGT